MALKPYFVSIVGTTDGKLDDKTIQVSATSLEDAIRQARDQWEPDTVEEISVYADEMLNHKITTVIF